MRQILHLTRDFPPRWNGGISTAVAAVVRVERAMGRHVTVVSFDGWRPTRTPSASEIEPLQPTFQEAGTSSQGSLRIYRCTSDVPIENLYAAFSGATLARVEVHHPMLWPIFKGLETHLAEPPHSTYVAHVHAAQMDRERALERPTLSAQSEARAFVEADLVAVTSIAQFQQLRSAYPVLVTKLMCRKHRLTLKELPRWIPYAQRSTDIGLFSRFSDLKNTDAALDAIAAALETNPNARAVVVGGIPDNPRTERKNWTAFLGRCAPGVASRIRFLGWLSHDTALQVMADTRIVLAPSRLETWGLVVQEAMALGACVIATPIPSHMEQIAHGRTGWIAEDASSEALTIALRGLLQNPPLQKSISDAASTEVMPKASEI